MAAGSQFLDWARGPQVHLIGVERVLLYADTMPDGVTVVRIAAPISYANVASQQFGALILRESASFEIGPLKSEQQWNAFGTIRKTPALAVESVNQALPVPLAGQAAVSHLTLFTPLRKRCDKSAACAPTMNYVSPGDIAKALQRASSIDLTFWIDLYNGGEKKTSCEVPITSVNRPILGDLQDRVFYGVCYSSES